MPNISFKVGSLDLSSFLRVNPDEKMDLGQGDMAEPAWSDSPFYEGQTLTSVQLKNKELHVPLFLHPPTPPYTQDPLNQLVQQINQALRPVQDLGLTVYASWTNAQASKPTFFTIQYGRFEPDFNFRITEKGWLAGVLHLWVLPYAHTATERVVSTYSAPANQSGMLIQASAMTANAAGGTIVGDVPPHWDLRINTGTAIGDDGRVGIISALPQASYTPIIPVGSFYGLSPVASVQGASGAWASQLLAMDTAAAAGASGVRSYFSFALAPASVYAGDNRVLGLVRARFTPFGLRAFDQSGNALGPTVIASALDGWQLVDYGVVRIPPWSATFAISVQAYGGIDYSASGMIAPRRAAPAWAKEHGPIFVLPNDSTILDLDWNSPVVAMDGFDAASAAISIPNTGGASYSVIGQDMLGNSWISYQGTRVNYNGTSGLVFSGGAGNTGFTAFVGTGIAANNFEGEVVFTIPSSFANLTALVEVGMADLSNTPVQCFIQCLGNAVPAAYFNLWGVNNAGAFVKASVGIPSFLPGQYHLRYVKNASTLYGFIGGPSGAFPGSASGVPMLASVGGIAAVPTGPMIGGISFSTGSSAGATIVIESYRARLIASSGYQQQDILHLYQPLLQNTRMNPSGVDVVDLQARQRGPMQAIQLPVPSLGAGLFIAEFPWDQGAANDALAVDVRVRERFTYAR